MSSKRTDRPRPIRTIATGCALLAALACAGCDRAGDADGSSGRTLTLFCGAGLRPPVVELIEAFEAEHDVRFVTSFAGSEHLIAQVKLTGAADLYLPGDRYYVDLLDDDDLIRARASVCYFVPTILVAPGNPKGVRGVGDLLRSDVKLGLGDENACAIGRTSKQIFEKNGIAWADVQKHTKFKSVTVNALGEHIEVGSLDAVIMWDAVAAGFADHGEIVPIPPELNVISTVDVAVLAASKRPELAERFVAFMTAEVGRAAFARHNYRVDAPVLQDR